MSENEFVNVLATKFQPPEWVIIPQVRNATGAQGKPRTADALAISTFPSRGIALHGFEFKDSRTDWLKELKDVTKADAIGRYCDCWWLAISDEAFVLDDELPPAWGLLGVKDGKVKVIKKAPTRETVPPTLPFVAAILRAAADVVSDESKVKERIQKAVNDGWHARHEEKRKAVEAARAEERKRYDELHQKCREFEKASGINVFSGWRPDVGKIGESVKFVLGGGINASVGQMERLAHDLEQLRLGLLRVTGECRDDQAAPGVPV